MTDQQRAAEADIDRRRAQTERQQRVALAALAIRARTEAGEDRC